MWRTETGFILLHNYCYSSLQTKCIIMKAPDVQSVLQPVVRRSLFPHRKRLLLTHIELVDLPERKVQVDIFQPADVHNDFPQFLLCRRILDNPVLFTAVHQRTMTTSTEGPFVFTRDMVQQSSPHILHISFKHYQFQCRKEFHRTAQICNEHEL